jgi:3-keto-5-aminohexanoate cleavage enzyme
MRAEDYLWDYGNPYEWMKRVRASSLPPLIVCCAITGGVQGKEANPNLPETPEEQAEQTYEAYQAGASMVHIHARNPDKWYDSSGSAEVYRHVHRLIRAQCPDIIINDTTGGTWGMTVEERMACLEAQPEMASLNMGPDMYKLTLKARPAHLPHPRPEVTFSGCMAVTYDEIATFARAMKGKGVKPEMEMYHPGEIWPVNDLIAQHLIDPPYAVQFVMGYTTSSYPTAQNLPGLIGEPPPQSVFAVAGIGLLQLTMTTLSILLGAHVRVGLEDNVYVRRAQLNRDNAEAVARVVRIARELGREIASPAQAREMLGLSPMPTQY